MLCDGFGKSRRSLGQVVPAARFGGLCGSFVRGFRSNVIPGHQVPDRDLSSNAVVMGNPDAMKGVVVREVSNEQTSGPRSFLYLEECCIDFQLKGYPGRPVEYRPRICPESPAIPEPCVLVGDDAKGGW